MKGKKCKLTWWIIGAVGVGIVLSVGIYAMYTYYNTDKPSDPRSTKVNELLKEAELLIEMGKRGEYYSKRTRG